MTKPAGCQQINFFLLRERPHPNHGEKQGQIKRRSFTGSAFSDTSLVLSPDPCFTGYKALYRPHDLASLLKLLSSIERLDGHLEKQVLHKEP